METINQMASRAVKAVWGDGHDSGPHKEPISGASGDVTEGEPYDAGNLDEEAQAKLEQRKLADDSAGHEPQEQEPKSHQVEAEAETEAASEPHDPPQPQHNGHAAVAQGEKGEGSHAPATPPSQNATASSAPSKKAPIAHYHKTTGLAADGGDFDASKPGAGREAERMSLPNISSSLMEEKGMRHDGDAKKGDGYGDSSHGHHSHGHHSHGHGHDKPTIGERIKHKLHKH